MASKEAVRKVVREVFGIVNLPGTNRAHKTLKKGFMSPFDKRYYPEPIDKYARKAFPEGMRYTTELEERRLAKLDQLRRRGKGPPKKGSGKRSKK
mmetsp:Transcript_15198/g.44111  ORF Transcript_15198/g.44111 Transcript_15198/m.44111 type:complete len:95 (+) Transcript_15198:54-338(+)|eukprot:CAMPEP_0113525296 /NCGR_PEP_ID=MMETSP0015_2-20120614/76_1 /TAXON_ID=2838 /ORGANISM="Odontella" /LENGTH=94 /DNA_ID=CAMNT_0000423433 /DNA_START=150 /DNA_END=434 /DNA_ORIENTATION=- /assembly_acc=CAM_ASM_000160